MKINSLFDVQVAKSHGTDDYDNGDTPFVTNSQINNGVIRFVEPFPGDKIFNGFTICISGLGFATLQIKNYLPKGNGGDSATILVPINPMSFEELLFYTAQFNAIHKWRFSFGRKCSKKRVDRLSFEKGFSEILLPTGLLDSVRSSLSERIRTLSLDVSA